MKTEETYWLVKVRFPDAKTGQERIVTLRAHDDLGLTFLQIASLKLQTPILETIAYRPVLGETQVIACEHGLLGCPVCKPLSSEQMIAK